MDIKDVSTFEIVEAAWDTLPCSGIAGWVFVVVDKQTGQIYTIYESQGTHVPVQQHEEVVFMLAAGNRSEVISNLIVDEDILDWEDIRSGKTRYDLSEEELYSCVLDALHERHEDFIRGKIDWILQGNPHLA